MRRPVAKVREKPFLALDFRAKFEYPLFPEKIHGEFGSNYVGEVVLRIFRRRVARVVIEKQGVAGVVEFDKGIAGLRGRKGLAVVEIVHGAFEQRVFVKKLDDAKRGPADREDVHAAVRIFFGDFENFGGAARASDATFEGEKHAELGFLVKAVANHLAVTRLENVQREVSAG